jgi:hypothetical protein
MKRKTKPVGFDIAGPLTVAAVRDTSDDCILTTKELQDLKRLRAKARDVFFCDWGERIVKEEKVDSLAALSPVSVISSSPSQDSSPQSSFISTSTSRSTVFVSASPRPGPVSELTEQDYHGRDPRCFSDDDCDEPMQSL